MTARGRHTLRTHRTVAWVYWATVGVAAMLLLSWTAGPSQAQVQAKPAFAVPPVPPKAEGPKPALPVLPPSGPGFPGAIRPGQFPPGGIGFTGGMMPGAMGGPALGFGSMPPPPHFQFKIDPKTPVKDLLPAAPKAEAPRGPLTSDGLSKIPEVQLHTPLAKDGNALRETAHLIAKINHLNSKKHDAFMEALLGERADLRGLPVAMGDACRTKGEQSRQFQIAANTVRQALAATAKGGKTTDKATPAGADAFWQHFRATCAVQDKGRPTLDQTGAECVMRARVAALTQMLATEPAPMRLGLAKYLSHVPHVDATRALARLAIFSAEEEVRRAALDGLKVRRERDYTDILLQGLRYPLPVVAKRAGEALIKLERTDLIPQLVELLEQADPRAPVTKKVEGKETAEVRELVKINHHRNCLLCHAPAGAAAGSGTVFTAPVPTPDQPLNPPSGGYGSSLSPEITVRLDVTYLRQDFSVLQAVTDARPWPEMQRFDFFVRTRSLTADEADAYRAKLPKRAPGTVTPYQRAALHALRELTGKDTAPTAEAWRELLGLQAPRRATTGLSAPSKWLALHATKP